MLFLKNKEGATLGEYAVVAVLIVVVVIGAFTLFGGNIQVVVDRVASAVGNLIR